VPAYNPPPSNRAAAAIGRRHIIEKAVSGARRLYQRVLGHIRRMRPRRPRIPAADAASRTTRAAYAARLLLLLLLLLRRAGTPWIRNGQGRGAGGVRRQRFSRVDGRYRHIYWLLHTVLRALCVSTQDDRPPEQTMDNSDTAVAWEWSFGAAGVSE